MTPFRFLHNVQSNVMRSNSLIPDFQKQLPAGALFYALLMAVLVAALSTALITTAYYNRILHQQQLVDRNLLHNAQEGIALLQHDTHLDSTYIGLLYGTGTQDSIYLSIYNWGLYKIGISKAFRQTANGIDTFQLIACLGAAPIPRTPALFVQDNFKPLAFCGKTIVKGDAAVPSSGIRPGRLSGHPLEDARFISGKRTVSENRLPAIDTIGLQQLKYQWLDAVRKPETEYIPDSLNIPFSDSAFVIHQPTINLKNIELQGHIIVVADTINVFPSAQLEEVLLMAAHIYIKPNFKGHIQAVASQALVVERSVTLEYPSGLVLFDGPGRDEPEKAFFEIKDNASISGYLLQTQLKTGPLPRIKIGPKCSIQGHVFTTSNLSFQGRVEGALVCSGFTLSHKGRSYYNYLLDGIIDANALPAYFVNSPVFYDQKPEKWEVVKWLD